MFTPKTDAIAITYGILIGGIIICLICLGMDLDRLAKQVEALEGQIQALQADNGLLKAQQDAHTDALIDYFKQRASRAGGWLTADYWHTKALERGDE